MIELFRVFSFPVPALGVTSKCRGNNVRTISSNTKKKRTKYVNVPLLTLFMTTKKTLTDFIMLGRRSL